MKGSQRKKIVVVGPGNSIFVKAFCKNVLDSESDITLISDIVEDKRDLFDEKISVIELDDICGYDKSYQEKGDRVAECYIDEKGEPDTCIIQYSHYGTIHTFHKIWKTAKRRILVFWGSDFYMLPENRKKLMRRFCFEATKLVFVVPGLERAFVKEFSPVFKYKTRIIDFGMNLYDELLNVNENMTKEECKADYGFPVDKKIIHIGYSSYERQNHISLIDALSGITEENKQNSFIVVPFPFSKDEEYKVKIENILRDSGIEGRLQLGELDKEETAKFRNTADIFLYGQTTDAGSQSVLEYAFMGAKVVMREDLYNNYKLFKETGYELGLYETYDEINTVVEDSLKQHGEPGHLENLKAWIYANKTWYGIKTKWSKII